MNTNEKYALADMVIDHALKNGAQQVSVSIDESRSNNIEIRDQKIDSLKESNSNGMTISLFVDNKYSANSTNSIAPQELSALLWIVAAFILIMLIVGVLMAVDRYVSETAVIRMVDEYEGAGSKMTVRQGFRICWSRASWRLFLINLIVNLPAILLVALLIILVVIISMTIVSGKEAFAVVSIVTLIGVVFLAIFAVVILSIFLRLLRQFLWRVCVLEDVGVGESFRRGFLMVRDGRMLA